MDEERAEASGLPHAGGLIGGEVNVVNLRDSGRRVELGVCSHHPSLPSKLPTVVGRETARKESINFNLVPNLSIHLNTFFVVLAVPSSSLTLEPKKPLLSTY